MEKYSTDQFTLPRSTYERYVAMLWLRRRWWVLVVPVLAAALAALVLADVRWLLVALMYMFIITPGIISMAYYKYLLTPEARLTTLPKIVTITPKHHITIQYFLPDHLKERQTDEGEKYWIPKDEAIPWTDVEAIRISGTNYAITLKPRPYPRFLLVPRRSLDKQLPFELITI